MRWIRVAVAVGVLALAGCASFGRPAYCDVQLAHNRQVMNAKPDRDVGFIASALSKVNYPGECPCPDDRDSAGNLCGYRSAYSRSGGAGMALCFPDEIPREVLQRVREFAAQDSLPLECGGSENPMYLQF